MYIYSYIHIHIYRHLDRDCMAFAREFILSHVAGGVEFNLFFMHACVCVCVCICIYIYIHVCVCVCICIYRHLDRDGVAFARELILPRGAARGVQFSEALELLPPLRLQRAGV